ncbi:ThiF family adenylyltransferase [Blastopirellula marina]|uniref:Thiamine biosynthesis protein ThiF n=1 Tax=Blastopirellula marina TaxID=124 RepID=A0A2S8G6K7_9BACT|nr:ThiF family adenylyltransferase [Blastopirellula marina]PQO40057.1 thiamine biosynthesis protein ThiF [Blastopirellula marina]PTL45432.1 thiamine biosynthesis protein ThiF [Blastopirellula marina]
MSEAAAKPEDRYARQVSYYAIGAEGQAKLAGGTALVVGLGALGSVIAETLARAGVGRLRIVDRDFLEWNNLQRQVLYAEQDVRDRLPKAVAAEKRLRAVNSEIVIEPHVCDVDYRNIEELAAGVDVIIDGTDNFGVRFLLNDASLKLGVPWIYGGCVGAEGRMMVIVPGETPCFRCLMPEPPPAEMTPTCDTAGVVAPIVNVVASLEALEAIKLLSGNRDALQRDLVVVDLWENRWRQVKLDNLRDNADCPACGQQKYEWLRGDLGGQSTVLCGRNAVQISFPDRPAVSLEALAEKLTGVGRVEKNPYLLRLHVDDYVITIFPDARAIIAGTTEPSVARTLYARYVGG